MPSARLTLQQRIAHLEQENQRLRTLLHQHGIPCDTPDAAPPANCVTRASDMRDKIALMMALFRGRTDVYAKQWRKEDRIGYSPVCANRWNPAVCGKPKQKCADCQHTAYQPLNEAVLVAHLQGKQVVGIYSMLPGDVCHFLAIDFDAGDWKQDVTALREACREKGVPHTVEVSRSGSGAHVWFFFEQGENAAQARRFGARLMDAAMRKRAKLSFASYDRMFPNQDTMPKGGIGNLIALPLQKKAAKMHGGSLFVDDAFQPYPDQWVYLSGIQRVTHALLAEIAESREQSMEKAAIQAVDFANPLEILLSDRLYIATDCVPQAALTELKRIAAFPNPAFYKQQAMRMPVWNIPRTICCASFEEMHFCLPRGSLPQVRETVTQLGGRVVIQDQRQTGRSINVQFSGILREEQKSALKALLAHEDGILSAATAFGKTVVGAALIAEKKVSTLILVNRTQLLAQWKERLSQFLTVNETLLEQPKKRGLQKVREVIGQYGAGRDTRGGVVDVAVMQALGASGQIPAWIREYGMVIVDECHHVPALTFENVLKAIPAKYIYGLTATPKRADGQQPILHMYLGPIRYQVDALTQAMLRPFAQLMIPRFTGAAYVAESSGRVGLTEIERQMTADDVRNALIADDVAACLHQGRNCLVLSERTAHVQQLSKLLEDKTPNHYVLTGSGSVAEKKKQLTALRQTKADAPLLICATGKYIGEGFDESRLDTLFLTMPISWAGTLAQYAGRLHRQHEGKQEVRIYDYIDNNTEMLTRMYNKRLKGYAAIGYQAAAAPSGNAAGNLVYSSGDYWETFLQDISQAEKQIVIASPYIAASTVQKLRDAFREAKARRVALVVLCRNPGEMADTAQSSMRRALEMLREIGAEVRFSKAAYHSYAAFDRRIAWYGGIQLLGVSGENSALRLVSEQMARAVVAED